MHSSLHMATFNCRLSLSWAIRVVISSRRWLSRVALGGVGGAPPTLMQHPGSPAIRYPSIASPIPAAPLARPTIPALAQWFPRCRWTGHRL